MKPVVCKYCQAVDKHTSLQCFQKPRKPIRVTRDLTMDQVYAKWKLANPPVDGGWQCYLQISPACPGFITENTLSHEHVIPKSRGRKYKYDIYNIKPSCSWCNTLKGSRTLEALRKTYPLV